MVLWRSCEQYLIVKFVIIQKLLSTKSCTVGLSGYPGPSYLIKFQKLWMWIFPLRLGYTKKRSFFMARATCQRLKIWKYWLTPQNLWKRVNVSTPFKHFWGGGLGWCINRDGMGCTRLGYFLLLSYRGRDYTQFLFVPLGVFRALWSSSRSTSCFLFSLSCILS